MIVEARYEPKYRRSLLQLVGRENLPEELWTWQFESNPRGVPFAPVLLCAEDDDEPVAMNGTVPVRVIHEGVEQDACWSCDFHVAKAHRGTGLGRRVKEILHKDHPLLMTFGVSPVAAIVLNKMGWIRARHVASYRRRRVGTRFMDRVHRLLQTGERAKAWLSVRRFSTQSPDLRVSVVAALPDAVRVDALWQEVSSGYRNIVVRDYVYLDWRYQQCPVGRYRFVLVHAASELRAIAVIREDLDGTRLVDLVAHADDCAARREIVAAWLSQDELVDTALATTSDPLLAGVLLEQGFIRARTRPGFFVRAEGSEASADAWFVMAGDSDGEFLQAARDQIERSRQPGRLTVRRMLDEEWLETGEHWETLLARSNSDPLFMGWAWQSSWWRQWGALLNLESRVLGVYRDDTLLALAPMYRLSKGAREGLRWTALHVMGAAWRVAPTVRTEYVSTIMDRSVVPQTLDALTGALKKMRWDLLVVSDHVAGAQPEPWFGMPGLTRVRRKLEEGVVIDTRGPFSDWLQSLGPNTRLKAYNRRRYLDHAGHATEYVPLEDPEAGLALLNDLHRVRWGKPAFSGPSLRFHLDLLARLPPNANARLSGLRIDGEIRSVLYDIKVDARVYNLQAGFQERYDPKVSLGTLHLGYAVEQAFQDPTIESYDLLAGSGKQEFYKARLGGKVVSFATYQFLRHPFLKVPWLAYRALPGWLFDASWSVLGSGGVGHPARPVSQRARAGGKGREG